MKPSLPVLQVMPALAQALRDETLCFLQAPPGSGKTTGIPLALLREPWLANKRILMLEPRRLAARAAATRMAETLGEDPGETVGYRVRFEQKVSANTRVEVLTEGILTRRLQSDPLLEDVGLIIFDEFHERNLHADLGLALALDIQQGLRQDLRLLLMSATLEAEELGGIGRDAPRIVSEGRSHPVEMRYHPPQREDDILSHCVRIAQAAVRETTDDLLVFLPGGAEIHRAGTALRERLPHLDIVPLYGDLPRAEQDHALRRNRNGLRKLVLATPIAETSLTIDGVGTVIDAGLERRAQFDPNSGLTRLVTRRISSASATQRAGRAGRQGPGVCYRLWHASEQERLERHIRPEILDADLAPLALELARWGLDDPGQLQWPDSPPAGPYAKARELLQALEALDAKGRITPRGREMAELGAHPRIARMLILARDRKLAALGCDLAALLSERDPLPRNDSADIDLRLAGLNAWRERRKAADAGPWRRLDQAARQWRQRLGGAQDDHLGREPAAALLAAAYPDRVAHNRGGDGLRFRLSNGRGARLGDHDPLRQAPYLVAAHLNAGEREGRIHLALPLNAEELRATLAEHIEQHEMVRWNPGKQAVDAVRETRLGALILSTQSLSDPDPTAVTAALLTGIRQCGLDLLPWNSGSRMLQQRVLSLRHWQPEENWPKLSDDYLLATLEEWLAPYMTGFSRIADLQRVDLKGILMNRLSWPEQKRLDEAAPTHILVPSGSRIALRYTTGEAPILAVRIQELFGSTRTPAVCGGKVSVNLHLLSPAGRPIQITQDLAGFWERTYPEVRKELKGRYPKHSWPDDPWGASPTSRARPRPT